eukprot:scaffold131050_cov60-Phaeocystis_antarctica.AAC.6
MGEVAVVISSRSGPGSACADCGGSTAISCISGENGSPRVMPRQAFSRRTRPMRSLAGGA